MQKIALSSNFTFGVSQCEIYLYHNRLCSLPGSATHTKEAVETYRKIIAYLQAVCGSNDCNATHTHTHTQSHGAAYTNIHTKHCFCATWLCVCDFIVSSMPGLTATTTSALYCVLAARLPSVCITSFSILHWFVVILCCCCCCCCSFTLLAFDNGWGVRVCVCECVGMFAVLIWLLFAYIQAHRRQYYT